MEYGQRLEMALHMWEDFCFYLNIKMRMKIARRHDAPRNLLAGPLLYAQEFRRALLNCRQSSFDRQKFRGPVGLENPMSSWIEFPSALWAWSRCSRRIYHVDKDLQALIEETSLKDVLWSNVSWPFESFAIMLDQAIPFHTGTAYDSMLVSLEQTDEATNSGLLQIVLLPSGLPTYKILSVQERQTLTTQLQRGNWNGLEKTLKHVVRRFRSIGFAWHIHLMMETVSEMPVIHSGRDQMLRSLEEWGRQSGVAVFDPSPEKPLVEADTVLRLVVGLLMYLTTLPTKSSNTSNWRPSSSSTSDVLNILHESEVCTVTGITRISPEGHASRNARRKGYEVKSHWREGYWRRAPGKGNDPTAPRTIWIQPVLVREDRLSPGSLPCGTIKTR